MDPPPARQLPPCRLRPRSAPGDCCICKALLRIGLPCLQATPGVLAKCLSGLSGTPWGGELEAELRWPSCLVRSCLCEA